MQIKTRITWFIVVYSWSVKEWRECYSVSPLQQMRVVLPAATSGSSGHWCSDVDVAWPPAVSHMSTTVHSNRSSDRLSRSSIHSLIFPAAGGRTISESRISFFYLVMRLAMISWITNYMSYTCSDWQKCARCPVGLSESRNHECDTGTTATTGYNLWWSSSSSSYDQINVVQAEQRFRTTLQSQCDACCQCQKVLENRHVFNAVRTDEQVGADVT